MEDPKKEDFVEALIRMHSIHPVVLTTDEYERLLKEVQAYVLLGDVGIMVGICARLLKENEHRYRDAKRTNEQRRNECLGPEPV